MERVTVEEARALAVRAFRLAGVGADIAGDGAEALLLAEMMGIPTHGLARVPLCVARLRAGGMDPSAVPDVTAPAPALRLIDARHALGPGAAMQALRHAIEAARETGLGGAFLRNATHLGALSPLLWTAAEAGFACIVTSNTTPMLAPPGGRAARVGNSPLGIGLPHAGGRHVLLDMALTVAARSKVRKAAQSGEAIPETWATDAEGRPTTDARAAMAGLMQAIGGAKGAALAVTL
ncbi:Ldh family oxidoreductase, partial [Roseicyclus sp.]|uniref:Ldh family oxidoreductase n=1 Tax=Roseicyclus sp. TaxID=1914329 RepID=UPI003F9F562B